MACLRERLAVNQSRNRNSSWWKENECVKNPCSVYLDIAEYKDGYLRIAG
jgi:hypothetical protein